MRTASTWGTWNERSKDADELTGDPDHVGVDAVATVVERTTVDGEEVIDLRTVRAERLDTASSAPADIDDRLEVLTAEEPVLAEVQVLAEVPVLAEEPAEPEILTRPPLELHEIHDHVQRELDGLEIQLVGDRRPLYRFCKRAIDLLVAVPALIVSSPIIAALALAIRIESKGPAVFRQQRVGEDGRVFTFYKFRTMYVDAKERFPELYDYDFDSAELSSRYYKHANDPRNTRLGAFVRKTTLDELPNLFNVVKGDSSLVGPRPELPEMIRHYQPSQLVKFNVKPGLTGLAACTGRNTLTIDEQIRADVEYVAGQSMKLDLWIMAETAKMIIKSVGAE